MITYLKIGTIVCTLVGTSLLGWWLGTNHVEGKWAKADNEALKAQKELFDIAIRERDAAQRLVDQATERLATSESNRLEIAAKLREVINREPITIEKRIETPGDCPETVTHIIDVDSHYRLWNDAIHGRTNETDVPAITADSRNGSLWPTSLASHRVSQP